MIKNFQRNFHMQAIRRFCCVLYCWTKVMDSSSSENEAVGASARTRKLKQPKEYKFPKNIKGFGYRFNDKGQLRSIKENKLFVFQVSDSDGMYNQKHYEALGQVIEEYIYEMMINETNLKKIAVPFDPTDGEAQSFFFSTEDALTNKDKLLILIHGSGVVRAGQWARRLIINEDLDKGTQMPYIRRAIKEGYAVIVLNTNNNYATKGEERVKIRGSGNPEEHTMYVWENYIAKAAARHIAIVAHSYGGVCTLEVCIKMHLKGMESALDRIGAIALTDSVHSIWHQQAQTEILTFWKKVARNWASSNTALDEPIHYYARENECSIVSAGHDTHEWTSWSAMGSVFKFLEKRYQEHIKEFPEASTDNKSAMDIDETGKESEKINKEPDTPEKIIQKVTLDENDDASKKSMDTNDTNNQSMAEEKTNEEKEEKINRDEEEESNTEGKIDEDKTKDNQAQTKSAKMEVTEDIRNAEKEDNADSSKGVTGENSGHKEL